jgi:hypothetical protein
VRKRLNNTPCYKKARLRGVPRLAARRKKTRRLALLFCFTLRRVLGSARAGIKPGAHYHTSGSIMRNKRNTKCSQQQPVVRGSMSPQRKASLVIRILRRILGKRGR